MNIKYNNIIACKLFFHTNGFYTDYFKYHFCAGCTPCLCEETLTKRRLYQEVYRMKCTHGDAPGCKLIVACEVDTLSTFR